MFSNLVQTHGALLMLGIYEHCPEQGVLSWL